MGIGVNGLWRTVNLVVELNGAFSNPFEKHKSPLWKLFYLKQTVLGRPKRRRRPVTSQELPRTRVPVTKTITQVLELANHHPMRVRDIHAACEELLGTKVAYRSIKGCLSENSLSGGRFVRVERGKYRLRLPNREL